MPPIKPSDFSLSVEQLRQRYTNKELTETVRLLKLHGETRYKNNFTEITAPDPGKMDFFSSEYAGTVASNILPSTLSMFTGLKDIFFDPIGTAEDMYELGLDGAIDGLKSQYDTWENAKRTIAKDPVGTLGMAAPGFQALGYAGKAAGLGKLAGGLAQGAARAGAAVTPASVRAITTPMAGLAARSTKAVVKPVLNMLIDPVGTVSAAAYKFAKSMMTGGGQAGRIGLEFITGESVQALESMQRAGRHLTDAQKELIGLNPFHWIGEFADPKQQAAFGTTAYAHFKQARKRDYEFNGMRDEFAIIGHLDSVVLKSQNIIVQQTQRLLDKIFKGIEGPEGIEAVIKAQHGGGEAATAAILKTSRAPGVGTEFYPKAMEQMHLGTAEISTKLVTNLNDKLKHLGLEFKGSKPHVKLRQEGPSQVSIKHDYNILKAGTILTGIDVKGLVNWINKTLDTDLSDLNNLKNALVGNDLTQPPQPGLLQKLNQYKGQAGNAEIVNAFYDVLREHLDDLTPTRALKTELTGVLPDAGELPKLLRNPTDDNLWGRAMRMQKFRDDIDKDYTSMKNGKSDDAAMLNNYIRTLRDGDKGIKKQLIDELELITGESVHAGIAGLIARKITPSSLIARGSAVAAVKLAVAGGAIWNSPGLLFFIPLASPRVVGSMLSTIGLSQRSVDYVKALTRHIGKHPVGKVLNASDRTIWSIGTAIDRIQAYNAAQMQQPQLEERY